MNRLLGEISLQNKNTGSLGVCWIVLHLKTIENASQNIPRRNIVLRHFIVTVVRNLYIALLDKNTHPLEGFAHTESLTCVLSVRQARRRG